MCPEIIGPAFITGMKDSKKQSYSTSVNFIDFGLKCGIIEWMVGGLHSFP
jgi:hypothetical protein